MCAMQKKMGWIDDMQSYTQHYNWGDRNGEQRFCMAGIEESEKRPHFSPLSATVAELKYFLAENSLPTTGKKAELQFKKE